MSTKKWATASKLYSKDLKILTKSWRARNITTTVNWQVQFALGKKNWTAKYWDKHSVNLILSHKMSTKGRHTSNFNRDCTRIQVYFRHRNVRSKTALRFMSFILYNCVLTALYLNESKYSGTSNFEHNPFQETVWLSSCSNFELNFPIRNNVNWINPFQTPKIYPI
jgi:hypothetical protein